MKAFLKQLQNSLLFTSVLFILLGAALIIWPRTANTVICYCFGGIVLLYGIIRIASYFFEPKETGFYRFDLAVGLIACGIGGFILLQPGVVIKILPIVVGLTILLNSVAGFQRAFDLKRAQFENWTAALVLAALKAALGALLLWNPFAAADLLMMVIGAVFIYNGVSDIVIFNFVRRCGREAQKAIEEKSGGGDF